MASPTSDKGWRQKSSVYVETPLSAPTPGGGGGGDYCRYITESVQKQETTKNWMKKMKKNCFFVFPGASRLKNKKKTKPSEIWQQGNSYKTTERERERQKKH